MISALLFKSVRVKFNSEKNIITTLAILPVSSLYNDKHKMTNILHPRPPPSDVGIFRNVETR